MNNLWMCIACYHTADSEHLQPTEEPSIEFGPIANGSLIYDGGEKRYTILCGQGHRGDEVCIFPCKPYYEPHAEKVQQEIELTDQEDAEWKQWYDALVVPLRETFKLEPVEGHTFVQACITESGYNLSDGFEAWLINKCSSLIAIYELTKVHEHDCSRSDSVQ